MSTPEVKESKQGTTRFSIMSIIGASLGCGLILAGILVLSIMYMHIPHAEGRNTSSQLPIQGFDIEIEEVQAHWQKAENERVALRAAIHPVAKIRLGENTKNGVLILEFVNSSDARVGDLMHIDIKNGSFVSHKNNIINAEGKELTIILESGFMYSDEYKLHKLETNEALWKLLIQQQDPETGNSVLLGHACVQFMEKP